MHEWARRARSDQTPVAVAAITHGDPHIARVLAMQRSVGNRATRALLQRLSISGKHYDYFDYDELAASLLALVTAALEKLDRQAPPLTKSQIVKRLTEINEHARNRDFNSPQEAAEAVANRAYVNLENLPTIIDRHGDGVLWGYGDQLWPDDFRALWDRNRSKLVWQAAERKSMSEELEQVLDAYGADYKPSQPEKAVVPVPQRDRPDVVPALDTSGFPGMSAATAGDLASFADDLIVRVLQYVGAVNRYGAFTGTEGTPIALDPASLARFASVSKAIYRFVRLYRVQLGFFGDEAQKLEQIAWDTSALKNPQLLTELTPSMLRGIKQAAEIVLKSVPPRSVLVGMGNSPAPIMGYLELHHPGELALVHMPMGNVHSNPTEESREADQSLEMYFKYFDLFPGLSAATVQDRTVVLLDYSVEGRALRLANHLLVRYYESRLRLSTREALEKVRLIAILSPQSMGTYLTTGQASETFEPHQLQRIEAKRLSADLTAFAEAMDRKWVKDHFGLMLFKSLDRQKIARGETPQLLPAHYQRLLVQLRRPLNDPELIPSDTGPF